MFTLPDMLVKIRYAIITVSTNEAKTVEQVINIPVCKFNPNAPFKDEFLRVIREYMEAQSTVDTKCFAYHIEYSGSNYAESARL